MAYLKPAYTTKSLAAGVCRVGLTTVALAVLLMAAAVSADAGNRRVRLSSELSAYLDSATTADIEAILTCSAECVERLMNRHGLRLRKWLSSGAVVSASKAALESLSQDGEIESVSGNAVVRSHMAVTTAVTGAQKAWAGQIATLGAVDGRGIGVAIIDSGIAVDHPALVNRVVVSMDFTDPHGRGHDVYGHGTHIAGIVAARGYQQAAAGADSGMAPAAHLINLKVLGDDGSGEAAAVVEAIDWAIRYRTQFGIRVVNLSLGAAPTQSYKDDPICLAVERAVKAGLVVVASAGNYGQDENGKLVFASVTSPGISPYAITVGATRTQGTVDPLDDEIAPWSSKGPTLVDHIVKPDLVAPGSKIVSTAVKGSVLSNLLADRFVDGPGARDYVAMSGTSMAAAVVSGAAALVLDGQGDLTPLQVKLALQGSADFLPQAGLLTSGAGLLDLSDLDELTTLRPKNGGSTTAFSISEPGASSQIIVWGDIIVWGNEILWGDIIVWGDSTNAEDIIVWGNSAAAQDIIVWGNHRTTAEIIVWGNNAQSEIIVWGNSANDIIVWGNTGAEIIVWGNGGGDIIVWGNARDIIVWGN